MRATSRRCRTLDPLAGPGAVRRLYRSLRDQLLALIPPSKNELRRLIEAVRQLTRRLSTGSRRGRPHASGVKTCRRQPACYASSLNVKRGRISPTSFVRQYLLVLDFPVDVHDALSVGEINF